jgi:alpha-1,2-mannosyltransferase
VSDDVPSGGVLADLRSALERLTRPPLVVAVGGLMLALLLGVVGRHLWQLEAPSGGEIDIGTGDFMAFWTGAVTLHEGNGSALYDYAAQQKLQGRLLGGVAPEFQPYLNPPLLAVLLSPLVPLGYVDAFYVYDAVCAVLLAAGLAVLVAALPYTRAVKGGALAVAFLVASYQPMVLTSFGGQNTAITFALLASLPLAMARGSKIAVAVLLGLLTYKPQYAVGLGVALLIAGWWQSVAGGAVLGLLHYAIGAVVSGMRWPIDMLAFMSVYRPRELANNAETHFSWTRTADFVFPSPVDSVLAVAGLAAVLFAWWRFRELASLRSPAWLALVICGTMLVSPHQQYYDVALLALPVCLLVECELRERGSVALPIRLAIAVAYVAYPAWNLAETVGIQPLFLMLLAVSVWAVRASGYENLRRRGPGQALAEN